MITAYPAEYFIGHFYGADAQRAEMYRQERRRLLAYKQEGAILDIGCGTGDFLAGFGDQWRKFGVEPAPYAANLAFRKGIQIVPDVQSMGVKAVDFAIFRGSIQHINEPFTAIRAALMALKPDGMLVFLATPNADSLCYRLFGELPALDPPLNYWIPGERTLTQVIRNLGGEVIRVERPYRKTPYARPARDVVSFIRRLAGAKVAFPWPGNMMEIYAVRN